MASPPLHIKNNEIEYILIDHIGTGQYGDVYKCQQKGTDKVFAIKVLDLNKNKVEKIEKEINILLSIQNFQHIVQIIDHFRDQQFYYIVTEFMEGGNLKSYLNKNKKLSQELSASFLRQIALGLLEIHSRDIIHRDLKPENILLSCNGPEANLKIIDFGLSNWQNLATSQVGSPIFSAPEL